MPRDAVYGWIASNERLDQTAEPLILHCGIWNVVCALDFNSDGKVVATTHPAPGRQAGMPCPLLCAHKLDQRTFSLQKKMCRDLDSGDLGKKRMPMRRKPVSKELLNIRSTENSRRQADIVDNDQAQWHPNRTHIGVGRHAPARISMPPGRRYHAMPYTLNWYQPRLNQYPGAAAGTSRSET